MQNQPDDWANSSQISSYGLIFEDLRVDESYGLQPVDFYALQPVDSWKFETEVADIQA